MKITIVLGKLYKIIIGHLSKDQNDPLVFALIENNNIIILGTSENSSFSFEILFCICVAILLCVRNVIE